LHSAADTELPAPLIELIQRTAEPFVQVIVDLEVPYMAFGRSCLIGDAAFGLRPHIGAGTAKAADDGWQLGNALLHTTGRQIPVRLKDWEAQQLSAARRVVKLRAIQYSDGSVDDVEAVVVGIEGGLNSDQARELAAALLEAAAELDKWTAR
jgi:2-polyprenyl-6-methoxyphenol hydroxylase-like FAD-dependent oxidoreductase